MTQEWQRLYDAAKAVLNPRRISEYVTCGDIEILMSFETGETITMRELTPHWWIP